MHARARAQHAVQYARRDTALNAAGVALAGEARRPLAAPDAVRPAPGPGAAAAREPFFLSKAVQQGLAAAPAQPLGAAAAPGRAPAGEGAPDVLPAAVGVPPALAAPAPAPAGARRTADGVFLLELDSVRPPAAGASPARLRSTLGLPCRAGGRAGPGT